MTAVDLDALDAARAAATLGPWGHHPQDPKYIIGEIGGTEDEPEWLDVGDTGGRPPGYPGDAEADAALIVAMHNALPDLIADARKLRALREAMEELADSLDVDSCDPMSDDRARLLYDTAERIRAALATALTSEGERE